MSENPYTSPKYPDSQPSDFARPISEFKTSGCLQFVLHMAVTSVLAPAAGAAVYTYGAADWKETPFLLQLAGSLVSGIFLLLFIWFITIPFGLFTYLVCRVAKTAGLTNRLVWNAGGTAIGLLFGLFMATWAPLPVGPNVMVGSIIGFGSSLVLTGIWMSDSRNSPTNITTLRK